MDGGGVSTYGYSTVAAAPNQYVHRQEAYKLLHSMVEGGGTVHCAGTHAEAVAQTTTVAPAPGLWPSGGGRITAVCAS